VPAVPATPCDAGPRFCWRRKLLNKNDANQPQKRSRPMPRR
jgi:hypothetical protein